MALKDIVQSVGVLHIMVQRIMSASEGITVVADDEPRYRTNSHGCYPNLNKFCGSDEGGY
jgi:hypothetical protein